MPLHASEPRHGIVNALHAPVLMLAVAALFWGMGFSWAKNLGDALNRAAGRPVDASLGPLVGLTLRFSAAALIWAAVVPASLRGWTWRTVRRGVVIGGTLAVGLVLQHLGLGRTDEATVAFLTNLTVVFVPLYGVAVTRRPPAVGVAVAVPLALAGLALLSGIGRVTSGNHPTGGDPLGVAFAVGCSAAFAAEILLLDRLGRGESAARIALALFVVAAVVSAVMAVGVGGLSELRWRTLPAHALLLDLAPLTVLTTLAAFALMTVYQPRVDPARATVVYLLEPIFAAAFAWAYNGRGMTRMALVGAGLILLANAAAEWKWRPATRKI